MFVTSHRDSCVWWNPIRQKGIVNGVLRCCATCQEALKKPYGLCLLGKAITQCIEAPLHKSAVEVPSVLPNTKLERTSCRRTSLRLKLSHESFKIVQSPELGVSLGFRTSQSAGGQRGLPNANYSGTDASDNQARVALPRSTT
jgi:hypothetical protein